MKVFGKIDSINVTEAYFEFDKGRLQINVEFQSDGAPIAEVSVNAEDLHIPPKTILDFMNRVSRELASLYVNGSGFLEVPEKDIERL